MYEVVKCELTVLFLLPSGSTEIQQHDGCVFDPPSQSSISVFVILRVFTFDLSVLVPSLKSRS